MKISTGRYIGDIDKFKFIILFTHQNRRMWFQNLLLFRNWPFGFAHLTVLKLSFKFFLNKYTYQIFLIVSKDLHWNLGIFVFSFYYWNNLESFMSLWKLAVQLNMLWFGQLNSEWIISLESQVALVEFSNSWSFFHVFAKIHSAFQRSQDDT